MAKELEAERLLKETIADEMQKGQTKLPSFMNIGISDQTELKTMVDAIAAASQREAEAHEMAIFLSKENDELRMKLKVLIEDNNKLIDLYERAVAGNRTKSSDSSGNPWEDTTKDHSHRLTKVAEDKELEMEREFERLKCQLKEMHEENDKLLSLYEKAMQERDELKKVIASGQCKNADDKGNFSCPEKLVEIDGGQCLSFGEASVCFENEHEGDEMNSIGPNVPSGSTYLDLETCLYEVHVQNDYSQCLIDSQTGNYSDSNEADRKLLAEEVKSYVEETIEQNTMEIDELKKPDEQEGSCMLTGNSSMPGLEASNKSKECDQDSHMNTMNTTAGTDLEMQENSPNTIPLQVCKDLKSMRKKLVEAQEKLSYSAETLSIFGSFERAMIEVDALSENIVKLECSIQAKQQECEYLNVLSSELQERKDLANRKLSALRHSLKNFSSSVSYFEQREALARSRLNVSSQHLTQRKEELNCLQLSRHELMNALLKIKQTETELRNIIENLRSKVEEENRKLESERVLFAIDNVEKPASDLPQRNWQVGGKATALLKSEEEKTKLQNQIKLNREKLGDVRKEAEAMNGKLGKMESEIQVLEMEVQKEMLSVEEMNLKLQNIVQEKEMLLEVQENGKDEFESMILEYHQSLFEADLKEEEMEIMQEELLMESRKMEGLQRAKAEVTRRKRQLLEAMSCTTCFVSDKVEADLHSIRTSVVELNSLLDRCGSIESRFPLGL